MAKKSTRATTLIRISAVQELLLEGRTRAYILEYGAEKWGLEQRQMDEYIGAATERIEEVNSASAERVLAVITSNLWKLYRRQLKKQPGTAKQILLDIARLRGVDKININLQIDRPHKDVSDEELAKTISRTA